MNGFLQSIFRTYFPAYSRKRKLPASRHRAAYLITHCRSAVLGGHVQGCVEGHVTQVRYNSCRHRLCAQCAGLARERWLEAERNRLLPCAHHHIIFTIPHEFITLWRYNRAHLTQVLFDCVSATLKQLLGDPRYLGAEPGILLALHTWSRSLALHPHIHALVTDGGLHNGMWVSPRRSHFLPARVTMMLFRGKFLARIRHDLDSGILALPPDQAIQPLLHLLNKLGRKKWNVQVCPRYAHGEGVVRYLARYVRGGPLKPAQMVSVDAKNVVFRYRRHSADNEASTAQIMHLNVETFLDRYLEHTPEPRQHQVRRYGLLAPGRALALAQARELLKPLSVEPTPTINAQTPMTWQTYLERLCPGTKPGICPQCGQPLKFFGRLTHAPPTMYPGH